MWLDGDSISKIAKQHKISRPTLQKWKAQGEPLSITGGLSWEEFRETDRAEQTAKALARRSEQTASDSLDFFKKAKGDIQDLYTEMHRRLMSGEGKVSFADAEKLLNIFIRLDNQGADRVIWMQDVMTKIIRAVAGVVQDERMLLMIKNEMVAIAAGERKKLGNIPGAEHLPTPAEIALEQETAFVELPSAEHKVVTLSGPDPSSPKNPIP